jgi:hypothetical protein
MWGQKSRELKEESVKEDEDPILKLLLNEELRHSVTKSLRASISKSL